MRLALALALAVAFPGCIADKLVEATDTTGATTENVPCGFTVRTSLDQIRVGERVDVIASLRNCMQAPMRWTDPDSCGFGPWLDHDGHRWTLQGAARDDTLCEEVLVPHELPPGGIVGSRGHWDGTLYHSSGDHVEDAMPGSYRFFASAGMGGGNGPRFSAQAVVRVVS